MKISVSNKKALLITCVCLIIAVAVFVTVFLVSDRNRLPELSGSTSDVTDKSEVDLGDGILITSMGNYTGLFLEDGSDELVTNVMMIVFQNTSDKDLQLARINFIYDNFTAEFEASNIPSGKSVVLLEKNRREYTKKEYTSITLSNTAFFDSAMSLMEETFSVTGGDGFLQIKNISSADVKGTTYIYYKNIADDTFYGGITYRVKVEDIIKAGESIRVPTKHFSDDNTCVVQVINFE